jgi:RNA polymerase sigma-70 factor (ECF subfamily)
MPDWDEILARDGPAVWRTAYRIVGNRADADECFQEAFLAAWEVARRGPVQHWLALLKRLVAARAVDRLRRRLRRKPHEAVADWDALRGPGPPPSKPAEDAELSAQLREALAVLPPKQAEAFCLQVVDGWSYAEIAEHMEETTDAVGVLLHRARKRLRLLLSRSLAASGPPRGQEAGPSLAAEESP